jgi:hypothetical protein
MPIHGLHSALTVALAGILDRPWNTTVAGDATCLTRTKKLTCSKSISFLNKHPFQHSTVKLTSVKPPRTCCTSSNQAPIRHCLFFSSRIWLAHPQCLRQNCRYFASSRSPPNIFPSARPSTDSSTCHHCVSFASHGSCLSSFTVPSSTVHPLRHCCTSSEGAGSPKTNHPSSSTSEGARVSFAPTDPQKSSCSPRPTPFRPSNTPTPPCSIRPSGRSIRSDSGRQNASPYNRQSRNN